MILKEKHWILILVLISLYLFFFGLGFGSLFETDEYIYTEIAKEIVKTGDFITLHFFGKNWFIHPPLYMWLTALTSFIFGWSEFSARFWTAAFGLALVLLTYFLGREMFNSRVGFLSGLVLATSLQYIIQSRIAIFDVPLTFFITAAVLLFYIGYLNKRDGFYIASSIFMGLATLTKGPIGIVLPSLVIFIFLLIKGELFLLRKPSIYIGLLTAIIIGGSWYFIEWLLHGSIFLNQVIGYYTFHRYFGVVETHSGPWFYYFGVLIIGFLPWTAFAIGGIANLIRDCRIKGESLFILIWILFTFTFFSLARTKLPGYIMSIYPFLSMGVAKFLDDSIVNKDDSFFSFYILAVISAILIFLGITLINIKLEQNYIKLAQSISQLLFILGTGSFFAVFLYIFRRRLEMAIAILSLTMCVFLFVFACYTTPAIEEFKPMKPLSREISSMIKPSEKVIGYKILYRTGFLYYLEKPIIWVDNERDLNALLNSKTRVFCLISDKDFAKIKPKVYVLDKKADILLLSNRL